MCHSTTPSSLTLILNPSSFVCLRSCVIQCQFPPVLHWRGVSFGNVNTAKVKVYLLFALMPFCKRIEDLVVQRVHQAFCWLTILTKLISQKIRDLSISTQNIFASWISSTKGCFEWFIVTLMKCMGIVTLNQSTERIAEP